MTIASRQARLSYAVVSPVAGFGEAVTLPTGVAFAVVDLEGVRVELRTPGSRMHSAMAISNQVNPQMHLREEDAEALREHDPVTVRGVNYLVVRLDPDGDGMTRVELMRQAAEPQPRPEWNQWR